MEELKCEGRKRTQNVQGAERVGRYPNTIWRLNRGPETRPWYPGLRRRSGLLSPEEQLSSKCLDVPHSHNSSGRIAKPSLGSGPQLRDDSSRSDRAPFPASYPKTKCNGADSPLGGGVHT